jgi:hypothetical protein
MKYLRRLGFCVARVEQRLPIPGRSVTKDCFGFGDLLAVSDAGGIVLVQTTTRANLSKREAKARAIPELGTWLRAGGKFFLHGWAKRGARGKRKLWELTEMEITRREFTTLEI